MHLLCTLAERDQQLREHFATEELALSGQLGSARQRARRVSRLSLQDLRFLSHQQRLSSVTKAVEGVGGFELRFDLQAHPTLVF